MKSDFRFYVEWDTVTWSRALLFWEQTMRHTENWKGKYGLELGAHRGGLSLYFAREWGCRMVCSDVEWPVAAQTCHADFPPPAQPITYAAVNALEIPYPDATFDLVVFKSMLGVIGRNNRPDQIEQTLAEIRRVLKPGGHVFWAENLRGSRLHGFARRYFVRWGHKWYYPRYSELEHMMRIFPYKQVETTGFLAAFLPGNGRFKNRIAQLDSLLFFLPKSWQYVGYGISRKEGGTDNLA